MAFRRTAFEGRWFDPNLGLTGTGSIRYDETEYCKTLERDGVRGVWVPSAVVQHFVSESRMRIDYVRKHFEGSGRANVRIGGPSEGTIILGAPVWLYRTYLRTATRAVWRFARRDPNWVESFANAAHLRGEILENRVYRRRLTPAI